MSVQSSKLSLITHRLHTQRLISPKFAKVAEVASFFGAVQAQDLLASLWAVGQRVADATEATVERAIEEGAILRTWPLRGTIHYVTPADVRWLLMLTAERTIRGAAGRHRQLGLNEEDFARSRKALGRALEGGRRLERHQAYATLEAAGVSTEGQRGIHILGRLALEGVLCIGPRQGKQPTFVLLDEWVPQSREMSRDEALAELARRYFTSHGPATLADYVWWSGLTLTEARAGLEAIQGELEREDFDTVTYWFAPGEQSDFPSPVAHLLPVYDEYAVGYKDRSAILSPEHAARPDAGNGIFRPPILIDGQIVGTWTRKVKKGRVAISPNLFRSLTRDEQAAFHAAADRYGAFLGLATELD
jgi:hypothetical protein